MDFADHRAKLYMERQAFRSLVIIRFCGILYVLRTGVPWRDLPKCYGNWHSVFMRFQRGNERALWWKILYHLQKKKKATMNVVICDSNTFKYHSHGGGQKGGDNLKEEVSLAS